MQTQLHFGTSTFSDHYVQDTAVAENVVQDVFMAIWANRFRLDASLNIKTYLYTAVKNQVLKHLRHAGVEERGAEHLTTEAPSPKTPEEEWQEKDIADRGGNA